jgi:hypothetical protein
VQPLQHVAGAWPAGGLAGGGGDAGLDDSDQEQGELAQQHVGADAVLEPVIDRAQVQDLFHVPPAAFDLEELLVAQRDVLGAQVRIAGAQQVFPVQFRVGGDLRRVQA